MNLDNLRHLRSRDEVKFVVQSRADYLWARNLLGRSPSHSPERVLFSPAHGTCDPAELAEWLLADRLEARIQLPLHRLLWPGIERAK